MKKETEEIMCGRIKIEGSLPRDKVVKKVVNTFIKAEYQKKGKGVAFRYLAESLPENRQLFIVRPGHKKNFDFKVEVTTDMGLEEGTHKQIALDLRRKGQDNPRRFKDLMRCIRDIYRCSDNNVHNLLARYPGINKAFRIGAQVEIILKVVKWLFVMEDIVYWDNEGRAFLYNFLVYAANEESDSRLEEAMSKVKNPDRLKSFMKKAGVAWLPYED